MNALTIASTVLGAIKQFGVVEDELLAVVNEAESKDPLFQDGGETIKKFLKEKVEPHLGPDAALAIAASVTAQILGRKPGYDRDHGQDA